MKKTQSENEQSKVTGGKTSDSASRIILQAMRDYRPEFQRRVIMASLNRLPSKASTKHIEKMKADILDMVKDHPYDAVQWALKGLMRKFDSLNEQFGALAMTEPRIKQIYGGLDNKVKSLLFTLSILCKIDGHTNSLPFANDLLHSGRATNEDIIKAFGVGDDPDVEVLKTIYDDARALLGEYEDLGFSQDTPGQDTSGQDTSEDETVA